MNDSNLSALFPISADNFGKPAVDARTLHGYLGSKQAFSAWIKARIDKYEFTENIDFCKLLISPSDKKMVGGYQGVTSGVGDVSIEYHLTTDMAKEVAMVERNAKGREVRKYFIACERAVREAQKTTPLAADTPATLAFRDVQDGLKLAELLGCPRSFAIQITCQHAERLTGYPVTMLANEAEACQNVPAGDVMLEPAEIGKLLDITGAEANNMLAGLGLQAKVSGVWTPTEEGKPLCIRHAWAKRNKSGYNLKWRYSEVEKMRDRTNPIEVSEHSL